MDSIITFYDDLYIVSAKEYGKNFYKLVTYADNCSCIREEFLEVPFCEGLKRRIRTLLLHLHQGDDIYYLEESLIFDIVAFVHIWRQEFNDYKFLPVSRLSTEMIERCFEKWEQSIVELSFEEICIIFQLDIEDELMRRMLRALSTGTVKMDKYILDIFSINLGRRRLKSYFKSINLSIVEIDLLPLPDFIIFAKIHNPSVIVLIHTLAILCQKFYNYIFKRHQNRILKNELLTYDQMFTVVEEVTINKTPST